MMVLLCFYEQEDPGDEGTDETNLHTWAKADVWGAPVHAEAPWEEGQITYSGWYVRL